MADDLTVLMTWLSPAYPVGAFTFSHGLETAVASGAVSGAAGAEAWVADCLVHGAGRSDAILLTHARRGGDIADLAEALAPSAERREETLAQGRAFAETTRAAWGIDLAPAAYPVVLGQASAALDLPEDVVIRAYLTAFAANLISAAIRLVPLGQTEGQIMQARFASGIAGLAGEVQVASLDDIGGCALAADIASLQHETQTVRLFRS
ncbi:MAG: urease accessory UreF family protein [Pseudomonadota bacterium]